ncbi:uncharacterized protein TNCV_3791131 [Trichonephila clavipes]|nr:uncharacterized protein TNCV_3791131 [Trichonephila clavipes]
MFIFDLIVPMYAENYDNRLTMTGEKKLGKVITPDPWKSGARNTTEGGGRKINENKALTANKARNEKKLTDESNPDLAHSTQIFVFVSFVTFNFLDLKKLAILVASEGKGCGSPVVKVSDHGRHIMSSNPVPLKTRSVEQGCTLNLSRAETSPHWCGVVVRRGGASSGDVHVT